MSGPPNESATEKGGRSTAVTSSREYRVARAFVEMADTHDGRLDTVAMLTRLVDLSVDLLAAEAAGLMLADLHGNLRVVAASNTDAELIEFLQLHTGQGPCLDCYRTGSPVTVLDLHSTDRWPQLTRATARPGFRSVHALPLHLRAQTIGTLNLFHSQPGPLPPADLALGQALADAATVAILHERSATEAQLLVEQLQAALNSRVIIEQAKGVIAQRHGVPMQNAFDRLRGYARSGNHRLVEIAQQVVDGRLDPPALPTGEHRDRKPGGDRHRDR